MPPPFVIGLAGFSGSGKTTLICALLPLLRAHKLRVSTVKHAHHSFDVDQPGRDSHRHREMGATEVVIASKKRWALMHENRDQPEPQFVELLTSMTSVDLVLVEGFKAEEFPKIFLHRAAFCAEIQPQNLTKFCGLVAIATDAPTAVDPAIDLPRLDINDPGALAEYILGLRDANS
ncbi:MAG: molybdopterin-guanine dinucleotide biosynthesis protein B [Alphaproteobacteria bacterium]|nr:molybdopterin-guanine dinucleotide biosynthesis protein B [Alphaproteobacteria bacterium]